MCKALFEEPSTTSAAAAEATSASAVSSSSPAEGASSPQGDSDAPRQRRPRSCSCRLSAPLSSGAEHQAGGGSAAAGTVGILVSDPLPADVGATSMAGVGSRWPPQQQQQTPASCTVCDGMTRSATHSEQHLEEASSERRVDWSLGGAVAAAGRAARGGGEWLRLLRKRPRPAASFYHSGDSPSAPTFGMRYRRAFSLPLSRKDSRGSWPRWRVACTPRKMASRFVRALIAVAGLVVLVWVSRVLVKEVYIRTYCFQVRALEKAHRPRGECPIVKLTRESPGGWGSPRNTSDGSGPGGGARRLAGVPETKARGVGRGSSGKGFAETGEGVEAGDGVEAGEGKGEDRLRFAIVVMCDEGMWPQTYTDRSIQNKEDYAALHGYDMIIATNADVDRSRPAAWSKLLVLEKHLGDYDYLIFVDIDALIMNPTFKLEWLLDVARKQQQTGGVDSWGDPEREADLIVTRDWNGPNSGVILIKNSTFSKWLLKEWWNQDQFVHGKYPFQYEQRAMHFLLQPDSWREAGLPLYANHTLVRAHTSVIDQCVMNSYLVHPWQGLTGRTKDLGKAASYVAGDFILHFAGKKGRVQLQLVDYYYPQAVKAREEYEKKIKDGDPEALATSRLTRLGNPVP